MSNSFNHYLLVKDEFGEEQEVMLCVTYDAVYEPAFTSGLPEDCYPDSSEMDITDIGIVMEWLPRGLTTEAVMAAAKAIKDEIEEKAWEDYLTQEE
jgi:hypothetical protein